VDEEPSYPTARLADGFEAGGKHLGAVQDEQVAGAEQAWKVREHFVVDRLRAAIQDHEFAVVALRAGFLRDQFLGQVKLQVRLVHALLHAIRRLHDR
jgi:hypothetical protein